MMRADEATVKLLDKMLQEMKRVSDQTNQTLELMKQHTPEGIIEPKEVSVTTKTQAILPFKKWFSMSVVNDGPNDCYIVVNTEESSTTPSLLKKDETFEIDLGVAKIIDAQVWCETGTASLRVRGVR